MADTPAGPEAGAGPWIVVTGATGALGGAIARDFHARGQRVAALDLRPAPALAEAGIESRTVDLGDAAAIAAVVEALTRSSPIGALVNAVGLIRNAPVLDMRLRPQDGTDWRAMIEANLTAPFLTASTVAARMARSGGGAIVNFSSISARGTAGQSAYSAAKAGIEGLTRSMAQELGPLGIRVNAVAPGFIDVASTRAALDETVLEGYATRTPLGRLGALDDVIGAVRFLIENRFVTGEILSVDGGLRF